MNLEVYRGKFLFQRLTLAIDAHYVNANRSGASQIPDVRRKEADLGRGNCAIKNNLAAAKV
jgi:hypothetical protein